MKILSVGNFGLGWDGSICDEEHIAAALEDLGHEVIRWQRNDMDGYKENTYQADLTLISQYDQYPEDLWMYLPGKRVYWAFDYQASGQPWHEKLVESSDLYLSKRIEDSKYPNWQWLSQDFAPEFLKPIHGINKDIDVLFTGSWLPWAIDRIETLKAVDEKFDLVVHSVNPEGWVQEGLKNVQGPIMDHALPELYARAKVILSIDHTLEAGYWSDRNAQIIACGEKPLFRYIPLSEARFHDDVDYFYSVEDCLQQIERSLIGHRIYNFADIDQYKVKAKVKDLLTIVGSIL